MIKRLIRTKELIDVMYYIMFEITFEAVYENWPSVSCFKYKSDFTECGLAMSKQQESRQVCVKMR